MLKKHIFKYIPHLKPIFDIIHASISCIRIINHCSLIV